MTALALLAELRRRGVVLEASGDRLRYRAPAGAMTAELRAALAAHKAELLMMLREASHAAAASRRPPQDSPTASAPHVEASALLAWAAAHGWPRLQLTLAEAVGAGREAREAFVAYVAMPQGVALAERNRRLLLQAVLEAMGQEVAGRGGAAA